MRPKLELEPKKLPTQERGAATFQALITATARELERVGYEQLNVNHVARTAGVGIASLYEYFPGKHALVAAVVSEVVDAVIAEVGAGLDSALTSPQTDAVSRWIELMFASVQKRRRLIAVLVEEVPFLWQVPTVQQARARLLELSRAARALYSHVPSGHVDSITYLMPVIVSNAVIDAVVRPPAGLSAQQLSDAISHTIKRVLSLG